MLKTPSMRLSVLKSYMATVEAHRSYFTDPNYVDDEVLFYSQFGETDYFRGATLAPHPIDRDALQYLVEVVGVPARELRLAGWASCPGPYVGDVLAAPAIDPDRGLLAVRALRTIPSDGDLFNPSPFTLDSTEQRVEPNPEAALSVDDVPVPFERGLFDRSTVWVSRDPVDALLLRALGVNATSLANPYETLGSREGLWHLQDLGAISPRRWPKGTLVIVDLEHRITPEQARLLNGQFRTVWMPGGDYTGQSLWTIARPEHKGQFSGRDPVVALTETMASEGFGPLTAVPVPLPPRLEMGVTVGPPQPFLFVPVSEMAREADRDGPEWIVKGFIAPGTITQFLGGSKAGKSTLLLSMLAEVSRGGTFLGQRCRKAPVLYVTEQGRKSFVTSLQRSLPTGTSVSDLPDLLALTAEKVYGRSWAEVLTLVRTTSKQVGARVVVFDTLAEAADVGGDAENSSGASRMLYRSLRGLLVDGTAVVAVRHTRKAPGGGIAESGLGSVANSGAADHLVRVRETVDGSPVRRVDTKGRLTDAEDFYLKLTAGEWVRVKAKPSEGMRAARGAVAQDLVSEALKKAGTAGLAHKALMEQLKREALADKRPAPGDTAVREAVSALVGKGQVAKEKGSGAGSPGLFKFVSAPTPS